MYSQIVKKCAGSGNAVLNYNHLSIQYFAMVTPVTQKLYFTTPLKRIGQKTSLYNCGHEVFILSDSGVNSAVPCPSTRLWTSVCCHSQRPHDLHSKSQSSLLGLL